MPPIVSSEPNWMNLIDQIKGSLDMSLNPQNPNIKNSFTLFLLFAVSDLFLILVTRSLSLMPYTVIMSLIFHYIVFVTAVITIVCIVNYISEFLWILNTFTLGPSSSTPPVE